MISTYTARGGDHLLRLGFAAKAAQQRRLERVAVVDEHIVVRALGAHASEGERDELAVVARLDQPLAVRVLRMNCDGREATGSETISVV